MTVVWPLCSHEPQYGSHTACGSKWVWWSMKPGATTRPSASIVRFAVPSDLPTPTILPWCTATSAWNAGSPEPSTTRPFLIRRSWVMAFLPFAPAVGLCLFTIVRYSSPAGCDNMHCRADALRPEHALGAAGRAASASGHAIALFDLHGAVVDRGEHLGRVARDDDVDHRRTVAFFDALAQRRRQ